MTALTITHEITIDASPERVWDFVGSGEGLSKWFGSDVKIDPHVGGKYVEHATHGGQEYVLRGEIKVYDPPNQLEMSCRIEEPSVWSAYTTIRISLVADGDSTHVTLIHTGFEKLPTDLSERTFAGFTKGWDGVLLRLQEAMLREVA